MGDVKRQPIDLRPAMPIMRWTAFSIIVSLTFVEIMGFTVAIGGADIWHVILAGAWLLALTVPFIAVFLAVRRSFTPQARERQIIIIIFSYLGLILSFGGAYYSMSALGDRLDARAKHEYYRHSANYTDPGGARAVRTSSRAFDGIGRRLWSGVDWPSYKNNYLRDYGRSPVSFDAMIAAAKKPLNEVSRFQYDARLNVIGDCVYFSIVTMATLGYGDIAPRAWFAKTAAGIQVLSGLTLFYLALSMVIGGWWTRNDS